ncbi:hypothetical protein Nepgr_021643 [Nepenthes gracilis]|uniref:Uncharacterized protein n=1 Tax=Nepenthes gracilis TaxID=150966 RepID=A0AAD3T0E5_NEPGR|nr:hypothetical protein Nepgr_021643 [Nepenthes gracilis]
MALDSRSGVGLAFFGGGQARNLCSGCRGLRMDVCRDCWCQQKICRAAVFSGMDEFLVIDPADLMGTPGRCATADALLAL